MSETFVQLVTDASNTGKKVRVCENSVSGQTVEQQVVTLALADATLLTGDGASLPIGGAIADNGADSGYPVKVGGVYESSLSSYSTGDRANFKTDANGRQLVVASGDVAAAATDGGNPVKVGAVYTTTLPAYTTGQRGNLQIDQGGTLKVGAIQPGTPLMAGAKITTPGANNQTLSSAANKFAYLSGFAITGLGATAAGSIEVTLTGTAAAMSFVVPIPAGATVALTPFIINFNPPLRASAVNTDIVVNVPSYGSGNVMAAASAWGFLV